MARFLEMATPRAPSRRTFTATGLAALAAPLLPRRARADARAEVLFLNGTVITMDRRQPRAQAVAVAGGKILAVGSVDQLDGLRTASTQVVDLAGGTLSPGLIDPHMHTAFVIFETWLDAGPMANASMDAVVARLKTAAGQATPGGWIKAWQYDPTITPGRMTLDKAALDAIAPDNPLFLFESNGHIAHVNSQALRAAGITRDTPDPPQSRYARDANGEPTGEIQEAAAMAPFLDKIGTPGREEVAGGIERLFQTAARRGCTGLFDASIGASDPGDLALLQTVMARDPPIRLSGALVSTRMKAWREMGLKPGFGDDRFRVDAIKAWSDGSNQGRTGYLRAPYLNSDSRGALNYSAEQLAQVVDEAHADGWQLCVHANGDAAIDVTLDAFAAALKARPRADHRHRIEHCSLLHDDQIARLKALNVSPSFLIGHVHYWGRAFRDDLLGPERADLLDRCASVLRAKLRPTLHSDWNVTEIGPLRLVENAVTRTMRDGGQVLTPGERVSVEDGLRMVTADAAWQCRRDFTGVLAPGKAADLVVLDQDPTRTDPSILRDIPVRETWLDGRRRHQA